MSGTATNESEKTTVTGKYYSLSPVGNADPGGHYSEGLLWALQNREKEGIKNIAITGPYGSGKSSILKTFQENCTDKDLVFLNISLATFKESQESPVTDEEMLRLIELSILQQIVYHEKDENIPDSRFKKTKNLTKQSVKDTTLFLFLFAVCLIYQITPEGVQDTLRIPLNGWVEAIVHYLTLLGMLFGILVILYRSIRPLRSIQLKKFNFQDAEFSIEDSISKSVLNDHINELLYFFEVTDYTVVVFEDLDRFQQTEIFTKLREINFLISNCEKIQRKITFIYAVRDDMFTSTERTKFFDFILPIVPVINSSNSNEIIRKIALENGYQIDSRLIDDISLFIDDMRLLYNVMNEYRLYHKKLNPNLNQNKLLALIFYKNVFPQDFVSLSNNAGKLYEVLTNKAKYVATSIKKIDREIEALQEEIKELQAVPIDDIHNLRKIYILQYLSNNPNARGFSIDGHRYTVLEMVEDDLFQHLLDNTANYYMGDGYGRDVISINTTFRAISAQVDPDFSYNQKLEKLTRIKDGRLETCSKEVASKLREKQRTQYKTIRELSLEDSIEYSIDDRKQLQVINILLKDGFIDEHYIDFISIFYEGSISATDQEFLTNVKAHIHNDFNYKLTHVDRLISKIPESEFTRKYVLNYDLLDYLLSQEKYQTERDHIIQTLCDRGSIPTRFLISYIDYSLHVGKLIHLIVKKWPEMWVHLTERRREKLAEERKRRLISLIVEYADLEDITKIANKTPFVAYCEGNPHFLSLIHLEGLESDEKTKKIQKIQNVVESLNLKLQDINLAECDLLLIRYVYENNNYQINQKMVDNWITWMKPDAVTTEQVWNYSFLNKYDTTYDYLLSYIDKNIDAYIFKVWSNLNDPIEEDQEALSKMLNNESLSKKAQEVVLNKISTKLERIEAIADIETIQLALAARKVKFTWENVFYYYDLNEQQFDSFLVGFLNDSFNDMVFAFQLMDHPNSIVETESVNSFVLKSMLEEDLTPYVFSELIGLLPIDYQSELPFEGLSAEKTEVLIRKHKVDVIPQNFEKIREDHPSLGIRLLEEKPEQFIDDIEFYSLDARDYSMLMASKKFDFQQKRTILETIVDSVIVESEELASNVGRFLIAYPILRYPKIEMSKEVITSILLSKQLELMSKIELMTKEMPIYTKEEFFAIMQAWPTPFNQIEANGKKIVLSKNFKNIEFVHKMYTLKYSGEPKVEGEDVRFYNVRK